MMRPEPLYAALRRQMTYALTAFVCAALVLEGLVPGAVLPFFDVVPVAVLASVLLVYDATRRSQQRRLPWVATVLRMGVAATVVVGLLAALSWDGRSGVAAAVVITVGVMSLAFWPEK